MSNFNICNIWLEWRVFLFKNGKINVCYISYQFLQNVAIHKLGTVRNIQILTFFTGKLFLCLIAHVVVDLYLYKAW